MLDNAATAAFGTLQTTVTGGIDSVMPIALGIAGLILAIVVGWKLIKRFTGR